MTTIWLGCIVIGSIDDEKSHNTCCYAFMRLDYIIVVIDDLVTPENLSNSFFGMNFFKILVFFIINF